RVSVLPFLRHSFPTRRSSDLQAVARGRFGMRARFDGVLRPGWCWLQSRFLLIGMAATSEPGGTRVALTGGLRIPGRAALLPLGVDRKSTRLNSSHDQISYAVF